jgi:hypothetical protein
MFGRFTARTFIAKKGIQRKINTVVVLFFKGMPSFLVLVDRLNGENVSIKVSNI